MLLYSVVAPEVIGAMGTATLPTVHVPSYLEVAREGRSWYQTWSHLTMPPQPSTLSEEEHDIDNSLYSQQSASNILACYADDGRIAVNGELSAGRGVYAAGSVAKYPNMWTGNADVAGVGMEDATQAGHVAAMNMIRDYHNQTGGGSRTKRLFGFGTANDNPIASASFVKDPIPVWRSDVPFQVQSTGGKRSPSQNNCLAEVGIQALLVGSCDSERFSTQGFWWTNMSRSTKHLFLEEEETSIAQASIQRKRRRNTKANPVSSEGAAVAKPIYGRGVVFYIDQDTGMIQGVMIWGLPFTTTSKHGKGHNSSQLNQKLVKLMQHTIEIANGGFSGINSEEDRIRFVKFLTERSKEITIAALHGRGMSHIQTSDLPRALIRYTEVSNAGRRRVRVLQRKNEVQGHGFLGEDLFARTNARHQDEIPPAELPNFNDLREQDMFSQQQDDSTTKEERFALKRSRTQAFRNWAVWEWYHRRWEENEEKARPPKEESLWLRKGDEGRGVSSREKFNESMMRAIFPQGR